MILSITTKLNSQEPPRSEDIGFRMQYRVHVNQTRGEGDNAALLELVGAIATDQFSGFKNFSDGVCDGIDADRFPKYRA
jgi:hypothetical protein